MMENIRREKNEEGSDLHKAQSERPVRQREWLMIELCICLRGEKCCLTKCGTKQF